ncbi:Retrovirus-related Pol polyprotein from transposon 17.6 [Takifugu flavidus]|uniref:ribonuclease H n=1 Tax=Takifugu flavidus TaxID=433684 RepID=A0A5C6ND27_9TELE|nr:Retrovirus-related Pol polyprotein from transposon 17.6 [Takifugu flavidus]
MELTSALVSGEVEVAVRPELPVDGVDLILGNDLAGDRVWPDQVGFQADHAPVLVPSMSQECATVSEVFTACAVTRAMAQANISAACEKKAEKMPLFIPVPLQSLPHGELSKEQKVDPPLRGFFDQVSPMEDFNDASQGYFILHDLLVRKWVPHMDNLLGKAVIQIVGETQLFVLMRPLTRLVLVGGQQREKRRPCTDFRKVNGVTKPDVFPLPQMEDCIDQVGSAKYVSKFDLLKGYWQVPLSPRAREISAFVTPSGLYSYAYVVSGLAGCAVYLDDVVVFSDTWEDHLQRVRALLERLVWAQLTVNLAKCEFAKATVTYLGKVVGQGVVRPVDVKVVAIQRFPVPLIKKDLMRFLGLVGYYRSFCRNFSTIVAPLTDLLKAKAKFVWSSEYQLAFDTVKSLLCACPVLAAPQFDKPFILQVDASNVGAGGDSIPYQLKEFGHKAVGGPTAAKWRSSSPGLISCEVEVAVRPELPVDGVDLILGNDLAGDRVWPDQVGFQADHAPVLVPSMSQECATVSEVFTACAVTRAMAQANISAACEKKAEKMPLFIPVPLQSLPHVLAAPQFDKPFILQVDASNVGAGGDSIPYQLKEFGHKAVGGPTAAKWRSS